MPVVHPQVPTQCERQRMPNPPKAKREERHLHCDCSTMKACIAVAREKATKDQASAYGRGTTRMRSRGREMLSPGHRVTHCSWHKG
ncbi:hypothetical protein PR048_007337 [Dryococelus australis]|uniref:Uncharacterized protein n=1 Tax=Dryococelus australis TaxID=614101 RepID=A0ABQ9IDC6_9NEOP|nr:hypothetical protein PR048_007337 [Dryococelus australis]